MSTSDADKDEENKEGEEECSLASLVTCESSIMETQFVSPAMKRTSDWILSQEFPSDITIQVGEATFNLHKLPLASKCGYIRKLVSGVNGSKVTHLEITGMPGDAKAFELVAKFCYGVNFEITVDNVATLRCAAEHLEMTEECKAGNLVGRTEAYLEEVALMSLAGAVTVLHRSEELLPASEKVQLIGRCIDAIACIACSDSQFSMSLGPTASGGYDGVSVPSLLPPKAVDDWWADELTALRIDTFQRVLVAMKARGFKGITMGTLIMLYAQKSLRRLDIQGRDRKKMDPRQEHEKRVVLETIVGLLPREKNTMSVSFLSMLLRAAIYLDTTLACRLDLEKRMAAQLGQAVLDDLLIPSFSPEAGNAYDVDAVQRILVGYLEHEGEAAPRLEPGLQHGRRLHLDLVAAERRQPGRQAHGELPGRDRLGREPVHRKVHWPRRADPGARQVQRGRHVPRHRHLLEGASVSERGREEEGVQGDGLPEAVAGGVRARGAERPPADADGGAGAVPRAAAPARGAAERRAVVHRRRVAGAVVQTDAELPRPQPEQRAGRGVAAAAGERRAEDGAAADEDADEGPVGGVRGGRHPWVGEAAAAEEAGQRRRAHEQRVQEARPPQPVRAVGRAGWREGAHEAAQGSEALHFLIFVFMVLDYECHD